MEQASQLSADVFDDEPTQQRPKLPAVSESSEDQEPKASRGGAEAEQPAKRITRA